MGLIAGPKKGVLLKCAAPLRKSGVQGTQTDYYLTKQVFMEAIRAHVRPRMPVSSSVEPRVSG